MNGPNMDYCKWQNTALAMGQCMESDSLAELEEADNDEIQGMQTTVQHAANLLIERGVGVDEEAVERVLDEMNEARWGCK